MIYPQPKHKSRRLKGKALHNLYIDAWTRDGGRCQECDAYVESGTPPHHKVFRSQGGEDTLDNLTTLCNGCHYRVHHVDGK